MKEKRVKAVNMLSMNREYEQLIRNTRKKRKKS